MKKQCEAPECTRKVEVSFWQVIVMMFGSLFRGGSFSAAVFCPEHNERITNGRVSDGNPDTNPDLNK